MPVAADVHALWATPFGPLLQRTGGGAADAAPAGASSLEALLHPLDETTEVALPAGAALVWSDAKLPLVRAALAPHTPRRAQTRPRALAQGSRDGCARCPPLPPSLPPAQVVARVAHSGELALLRVQLAPPRPGGPPGAQARRVELVPLWSGVPVRGPRAALHCRVPCCG
jgi:hypothetical protein